MLAERTESRIALTAKDKFQAEESKSRIQDFYNVALSLGDSISAGIAGLCVFDPANSSAADLSSLDSLDRGLRSEGFDLSLSFSIAQLLMLARHLPDSLDDFLRHGTRTIEEAIRGGRRDQLETVCQVVARATEEATFPLHRTSEARDIFRNAFPPHLVVSLAARDPKSARTIVALGKRLRDREWALEIGRRFIDFRNHTMPSFETTESPPGDWLEWLRLLREVSGPWLSSHQMERTLHPAIVERVFHPSQLIELIERNPEAALEYVQLARELSGRYFERFIGTEVDSQFFERAFHPLRLMELVERSPQGALAHLQIIRELGGGQYLERFSETGMDMEFFERMFRPRRLVDLVERDPEVALAFLQVVRQLGGERHIKRFADSGMDGEFFERMFYPRRLAELIETNPEGALASLQVVRELGGGQYLERIADTPMGSELADRIFHARHLMELIERNPEGALALVQLVREVGGGRYLDRLGAMDMDPEFFERIFHLDQLLEFNGRRNSPLVLCLACARIFQSKRLSQTLAAALNEGLRHREDVKHRLSLLPISSLRDLRWLSEQGKNPELKSLVARLTA
jgi:hypothetical protein